MTLEEIAEYFDQKFMDSLSTFDKAEHLHMLEVEDIHPPRLSTSKEILAKRRSRMKAEYNERKQKRKAKGFWKPTPHKRSNNNGWQSELKGKSKKARRSL